MYSRATYAPQLLQLFNPKINSFNKTVSIRTGKNIWFKRNYFIYAKFFQWFLKCFFLLSNTWQIKDRLNSKFICFFITKKNFSFFTVLAKGMVCSSNNLMCIHLY